MQIDSVGAVANDLVDEQVCDPGRERALGGAGKAAVEIAPVRQVTGLVDEAVDVDHRHRHQRAGQPVEGLDVEQPADDLDSVELVTVHGRGDEQAGAVPLAVHDMHRHG